MVYNIEGNKNRCGRSCGSNFGISRGYNINYSYFFQSTDGLCSKSKFKFTLGSASYKL